MEFKEGWSQNTSDSADGMPLGSEARHKLHAKNLCRPQEKGKPKDLPIPGKSTCNTLKLACRKLWY